MSLFADIDEVRTNVESGLDNDGLTLIWESAEQLVEQKYGSATTETEVHVTPRDEYPLGRDKKIVLERKVSSIISVSEQWNYSDATTLAADDYELRGRILDRLPNGTNGRLYWGHKVTVVYVPRDTTERRKEAIVQLIKLGERYNGAISETMGDASETHPDYMKERDRILSTLNDVPF